MDDMGLDMAMFCNAFPCNPIPFAQGLADYIREEQRSAAIHDDKAKRILWVLMAQSYGQLATIDLLREWHDLSERHRTGKEVANG